MITPPHPFASASSLEQGFADGLANMLAQHPGLGVYILVLANAASDASLWAQLASALSARHEALSTRIIEALRQGQKLDEPDDDVMVFLKLHAMGFPHLKTLESRRAGRWDVFFNPIRALRPPRMSGLKFESLLRPFDPSGFHFNRAFLAREIFWEGELAGKPARILYNKFPFARLHGLLVPEPARQSPQYLSPELHAWAWDICVLSELPGLCLGYNSYGAGASVNHLHFQSFVQPHPLPVQDPRFVHNGGTQPYPLLCQRYADAESAWLQIDQLHQSNTPYNLVYSQAGVHLIPRVPQDSKQLTAACNGYGWSEMAGAVTLFSREAFEHLDSETFEAELAQFALPG